MKNMLKNLLDPAKIAWKSWRGETRVVESKQVRAHSAQRAAGLLPEVLSDGARWLTHGPRLAEQADCVLQDRESPVAAT